MRWGLFWRSFLRTLFILYCIEAGVFLVLLPWKDAWEQIAVALPQPVLRDLLIQPLSRAAVTGFGLVHLVWGAHDLEDLLMRRREARQPRSDPPPRETALEWQSAEQVKPVGETVEKPTMSGVKGSRGA